MNSVEKALNEIPDGDPANGFEALKKGNGETWVGTTHHVNTQEFKAVMRAVMEEIKWMRINLSAY